MSRRPPDFLDRAVRKGTAAVVSGWQPSVPTREPEKSRYIDVGTFANPDAVIVECLHHDTVPVESAVLGAPVAELCLTCDRQLDIPWPEAL